MSFLRNQNQLNSFLKNKQIFVLFTFLNKYLVFCSVVLPLAKTFHGDKVPYLRQKNVWHMFRVRCVGLRRRLGLILIKTGNALKLLKKYLESIFEAAAWGSKVFIPCRWRGLNSTHQVEGEKIKSQCQDKLQVRMINDRKWASQRCPQR